MKPIKLLVLLLFVIPVCFALVAMVAGPYRNWPFIGFVALILLVSLSFIFSHNSKA